MAKRAKSSGFSETQVPFEAPVARPDTPRADRSRGGFAEPVGKLVVGAGGRVVIPAEVRGRLGIKEGDALVASLADGELRLMSLATAVRRAQAMVAPVRPADGTSVVDELIADRRRDAAQEAS